MEEFFLGLFALTLFGSAFWFWAVASVFILICIASDVKKNGFYAFGTLVVVSLAIYFWDNSAFVHFKSVVWNLKNLSIYLGLGLGFASIRTFAASRKVRKELKDLPETSKDSWVTTKDKRKAEFLRKLGGNVSRWWLMWPISLIVWSWKSLLADAWDFIWSKVKGYFIFIAELGLK